MKRTILFLFIFLNYNLFAQWKMPQAQIGGAQKNDFGFGIGGGNQEEDGGESSVANPFASKGDLPPLFQNNFGRGKMRVVRPQADCPFLTMAPKDDQDLFGDLKNYLSSFSLKSECSQNNATMQGGKQTLSALESMLNRTNSTDTNCYSSNVSKVSDRNVAFYYVQNNIDIPFTSPYSECNSGTLSLKLGLTTPATSNQISDCVNSKYDFLVMENSSICRETIVPKMVEEQMGKTLQELEGLLVSAIKQTGPCSPKPIDAMKMTMNAFLKIKSLSVIGPWGMVAGFGADIMSTIMDKFFPNDSERAGALLEDILNEENYEQNACLYLNVSQKIYCYDKPSLVMVPEVNTCDQKAVNENLVKLIQEIESVKKTAEAGNPGLGSHEDNSGIENSMSDLSKYLKASEDEIRARVKKLPKIAQALELKKVNKIFSLLKDYEELDPTKDDAVEKGHKILEDFGKLFLSANSSERFDIENLIFKTTPGENPDRLKQIGIAKSVEKFLAQNEKILRPNEERSRSFAKYNKYKNAMGELANIQFKKRLQKQFSEFKEQVLYVSQHENGKVPDLVSEGLFRNIIRHCTLMQEIYDPDLKGIVPEECQKLNCQNENRFEWFSSTPGNDNLSLFKKQYCDKNFGIKRIEDQFLKELKDPSGARICGKKVEDFF